MFILYNSFIIVLYEDSKECFGMAGARPDPIQDVSVTSLPKESKLKKKKKTLGQKQWEPQRRWCAQTAEALLRALKGPFITPVGAQKTHRGSLLIQGWIISSLFPIQQNQMDFSVSCHMTRLFDRIWWLCVFRQPWASHFGLHFV